MSDKTQTQLIEEAGRGGWTFWGGEWSVEVGDFNFGTSLIEAAEEMGHSDDAWNTAKRMEREGFAFVVFVEGIGWSSGRDPTNGGVEPWHPGYFDTLAELLAVVGIDPDKERDRKRRESLERAGQERLFG